MCRFLLAVAISLLMGLSVPGQSRAQDIRITIDDALEKLLDKGGDRGRRGRGRDAEDALRGWKQLGGRQRVARRIERDTVQVGRKYGRLSRVRLRAYTNDVFVARVVIEFGNGQRQGVALRRVIPEGRVSPVIRLDGNRRFIRKIELVYRTAGSGDRARMEVFGIDRRGRGRPPVASVADVVDALRSDGYDQIRMIDRNLPRYVAEACRENRRYRLRINRRARVVSRLNIGRCGPPAIPDGWVRLESVRVDRDRDRDVIRVGASEGRFDGLRLRVRRNDIRLNRVVVRFGNGERQAVRVRDVIRANTLSEVLELDGRWGRRIRTVTLVHRTRGRGPRAVVDVLAKEGRRRPALRPSEIADVLRREGYDEIRMIDRELPRYVAEACRNDVRYRLRMNRYGAIRNRSEIGRCGPPAIPDGWVRLESVRVDRDRDRDVIRVGASEGRFDALRLRVRRNDIRLNRVVVRFGNGERQAVRVRDVIPQNTLSEVLELDGRWGRRIRTVTLVHRTRGGGPRAVADVLAKEGRSRPTMGPRQVRAMLRGEGYTNIRFIDRDLPRYKASACQGDASYRLIIGRFGQIQTRRYVGRCDNATRPGRSNWHEIDNKVVGWVIDRDVVDVGRDKGRFRALRLEVRENPLFLARVQITFGNGETRELAPSTLIQPGGPSEPYVLGDRARYVDRVVFWYRSLIGDGLSRVTLYGDRVGGSAEPGRDDELRDVVRRLRARRFNRIRFVERGGSRLVAEACRNDRLFRLTLRRNGRVIRRERLGACQGSAGSGYDLAEIKDILESRRYYNVDFTDRTGPSYAAEVCRNARQFRVRIDRFGEIESRRRIGFCQPNRDATDDEFAFSFNVDDLEGRRRIDPAECQDYFEYLLRSETINFDVGSSRIRSDSLSLLDRLADVARRCPEASIEVAGHTDSQGSRSSNQELSERRANSVTNYLIDQGVPPRTLTAVGYGEAQPIASNSTADGRARNRRIEFVVDWVR